MIRIFFTNFGHYAEREFNFSQQAFNYMKSTGFECTAIHTDKNIGAMFSYSPIGGLRVLNPNCDYLYKELQR